MAFSLLSGAFTGCNAGVLVVFRLQLVTGIREKREGACRADEIAVAGMYADTSNRKLSKFKRMP
jgi:hypothetical protein